MRRTFFLLCCLLGACGEAGPPTVGTPIDYDTVCDKANDGKRLMLEGYLDFPEKFSPNEISIMLRIRPKFDSAATVVGVGVKLGTGPNTVEIPPKSFRTSDLKVHLANGNVVGYRDKVKASGTMYTPSSMAKVEFKCGLTNPLLEAAGQ